MNIGGRNSAILILVVMDAIFFATAIALTLHGVSEALSDKVWGIFAEMNGALLLILKADDFRRPDPTQPVEPAQPNSK